MPLTEQDLAQLLPRLSPRGIYVTGDDHLLLTSLNSVASAIVQVSGRQVLLTGRPQPFLDRHVCTSDRVAATSVIRLAEGWLTDVSVIVTGAAPRFAQTYVRVDLFRGDNTGRTVLATLIEGCPTAAQRVAYPGSPLRATIEQPGTLRVVSGTAPAVATDLSETVPTGARWRPLAIRARFATDANPANRFPRLFIGDGVATDHTILDPPAAQTASLTHDWIAVAGGERLAVVSIAPTWGFPVELRLVAGSTIVTNTANIQAGDQWTNVRLLVEEWLEGA